VLDADHHPQIKLLPASFSYSPLVHPLGGAPLLRRDLFDARFQLAQNGNESDDEDEDEAAKGKGKQATKDAEGEAYIDADTDLIPGTYEGGLKSWEGGLDLVEVMARNVGGESESESEGGEGEEAKIAAWVRGSRVLEVCSAPSQEL
jgi:protein-histidine N-methyltransferase